MKNIMTFKGISNKAHGIIVTAMPAIPAPEERGEAIEIPGRNGELWRGDGSYMPITLNVPIYVPPTAVLSSVAGWLSGEGNLTFGTDTAYWAARVTGETHFAPCTFNDGWQTTVAFACNPLRYVPSDAVTITSSPYTLANPYTAYAEPLIEITGSGDISLTVGGTTCTLTGISGTITLDTELQECYQGNALKNDIMTGAFPVLAPGSNAVSYTGSVTTLKINPRWRTI